VCAHVLLQAIKAKCGATSAILLIYHQDADAGGALPRGTAAATATSQKGNAGPAAQGGGCLPSNGIFDANLHFANGAAFLRDLC